MGFLFRKAGRDVDCLRLVILQLSFSVYGIKIVLGLKESLANVVQAAITRGLRTNL